MAKATTKQGVTITYVKDMVSCHVRLLQHSTIIAFKDQNPISQVSTNMVNHFGFDRYAVQAKPSFRTLLLLINTQSRPNSVMWVKELSSDGASWQARSVRRPIDRLGARRWKWDPWLRDVRGRDNRWSWTVIVCMDCLESDHEKGNCEENDLGRR